MTPLAVALAFANDVLRMRDSHAVVVGGVGSTPPSVEVTPETGGPATTIAVVEGADGSWWVSGCANVDVQVTTPTPGATVTSPINLAGESTAFEAVVNVSVFTVNSTVPISTGTVRGGSNGVIAPFHGSVAFPSAPATLGYVVLYVRSARDGSTATAAAVRVRL